jgi:site-specific recombinase XerD
MPSELRTKLIAEMNLHGLAANTQRGYVMSVKGLAAYYKESPETLTDEQIRTYFQHLLEERKLTRSSCRRYLTGLIFFYRHVCHREVNDRFGLPPFRGEKKLPIVLSIEEVTRLLSCVENLKHRVLLKTIYSAGLRVSEAVQLKVDNIESDPSRMLIRVDQGKGKKDRYTILSKNLLAELRLYWKKYRPEKWLFPGYGPDKHLCTIAAQKVFYNAKKKPA